ncbi:hypothetical protein V8F06_000653 [Rhypophila decipiens]
MRDMSSCPTSSLPVLGSFPFSLLLTMGFGCDVTPNPAISSLARGIQCFKKVGQTRRPPETVLEVQESRPLRDPCVAGEWGKGAMFHKGVSVSVSGTGSSDIGEPGRNRGRLAWLLPNLFSFGRETTARMSSSRTYSVATQGCHYHYLAMNVMRTEINIH